MPAAPHKSELPPVPAKRYFTIGEVSELCLVKQHVLRYWEQEFSQLKPMKRRGNRRYYQHHEVMLIRRIRTLLYDEGFTISGARLKLDAAKVRGKAHANGDSAADATSDAALMQGEVNDVQFDGEGDVESSFSDAPRALRRSTNNSLPAAQIATFPLEKFRSELSEIAKLLE